MIDKEKIGINAGIVWRFLDKRTDSIPMNDLPALIGLTAEEVALAVGWLAREDKVCFCEVDGTTRLYLNPVNIFI